MGDDWITILFERHLEQFISVQTGQTGSGMSLVEVC